MKNPGNVVRIMQNFIEDNLHNSISLNDLSKQCHTSPYQCERKFKEMTQINLYDYIRERRLTSRALYLQDDKTVVEDFYLSFLFSSDEILPSSSYSFIKNQQLITEDKSKMTNELSIEIITFPRRKLLFKRSILSTNYQEFRHEYGDGVWKELCRLPEALYEPMFLTLPSSLQVQSTTTFVVGVYLPHYFNRSIPGFELLNLEPVDMMVIHTPYKPCDDKFLVDLNFDIEYAPQAAPSFELENLDQRGCIYGQAIKKVVPHFKKLDKE